MERSNDTTIEEQLEDLAVDVDVVRELSERYDEERLAEHLEQA